MNDIKMEKQFKEMENIADDQKECKQLIRFNTFYKKTDEELLKMRVKIILNTLYGKD